MPRAVWGLVFLSLVTVVAHAREIRRLDRSTISREQIDATVKRLMEAAHVPGLGLAVIEDGRIAYVQGYGFRNVEKKLSYTPETVVYAASFTKTAFAYTVLQAVEKGTLDLDRPVYRYLAKPLPEYEKYASLKGDERWKKITARMLLSHTSGLPNWRFLEDDRQLRIHFDPGSRYAYSGEGLVLLQMVMEEVTKQSLGELMQKEVFEPLAMKRSSMTWRPEFEDNFADGYLEDGKDDGPQKRTKANAAGSMVTTIADYARFVQALMAGERLSPMRDEMLQPQIAINFKHQFPTFEMQETAENKKNPAELRPRRWTVLVVRWRSILQRRAR